MNKNVTIGILIVIIILVIGYFAIKGNTGPTMTVSDTSLSTSTTPTTTDNTSDAGTISQPGAPAVETGTDAISFSSAAIVSGKVRPDGAATAYWYEYGLTQNLGSKTSSQNIGSGFNSITAPGYITGLKANTQYYFRLNASNAYGTVHGAVYSFKTNTNPAAQPILPVAQTNAASGITRTSATANGHVNPEGYATSYWFEFGTTSALGNLTGYTSAGDGKVSTAVSASLPDLKPLTKYYYRVNAQNQFGTVTGSIQSFTTAGPAAAPSPSQPAVTTNAATNVATSTVTFNGKVDPHGADTTYWFEYSKDSTLGKIIGTATPDQTMNGADAAIGVKADVTGLDSNTRYYYRLMAKNQYGTVTGTVANFRTK